MNTACLAHTGKGASSHEIIQFTKEQITIGRSKQATFTIDSNIISRYHVLISLLQGDRWSLMDTHSLNGTYVNGHQLRAFTPYLLHEGDVVLFCESDPKKAEFQYIFHNCSQFQDPGAATDTNAPFTPMKDSTTFQASSVSNSQRRIVKQWLKTTETWHANNTNIVYSNTVEHVCEETIEQQKLSGSFNQQKADLTAARINDHMLSELIADPVSVLRRTPKNGSSDPSAVTNAPPKRSEILTKRAANTRTEILKRMLGTRIEANSTTAMLRRQAVKKAITTLKTADIVNAEGHTVSTSYIRARVINLKKAQMLSQSIDKWLSTFKSFAVTAPEETSSGNNAESDVHNGGNEDFDDVTMADMEDIDKSSDSLCENGDSACRKNNSSYERDISDKAGSGKKTEDSDSLKTKSLHSHHKNGT